jgi:Rad3-related DNA helicase
VPPDADALLAQGVCDCSCIREEADRQRTCGHALAHAAAAQADVVVGDLNFGFEPGVRARGLLENGRWVAVVDEAHQLPERAREWGSPSVYAGWVDAMLDRFPLTRIPALADIARDVRASIEDATQGCDEDQVVELSPRAWRRLAERIDEAAPLYAAWMERERARPVDWGTSGVGGAPPEEPWLDFARAVARFAAALERAGEETVAIASYRQLRLVCRDSAPVLRPSMAGFHAVVCASATLHPTWFFRAQVGLPEAEELVLPSPFPPEHRRVLLVRGVSTSYRHREVEWPKLAEILARLLVAIPGNVAIFAPSFDMLHWLAERVDVGARDREVQVPATDDAERELILSGLREGGNQVLFAVLGGVFAEGVDLPGGALAAAVIVSPSLPPPSVERKLLEDYLERLHGQGHALAYLHPGMTRVVQAAGRVVRGPGERGLVALVCRRFLQRSYREYLPADWEPVATSRPWVEAGAFFAAGSGGDR